MHVHRAPNVTIAPAMTIVRHAARAVIKAVTRIVVPVMIVAPKTVSVVHKANVVLRQKVVSKRLKHPLSYPWLIWLLAPMQKKAVMHQ